MPDAGRPPLGAAIFSAMVPCCIILVDPEGVHHMSFGNGLWGVLRCELEAVDDPAGVWKLWRVVGNVGWTYVTDPDKWFVIPHVACSPLELQAHSPSGFPCAVRVRETAPRVTLLRYALSEPVSMSMDTLTRIAGRLGLTFKRTKASIVEAMATYICRDDPKDIWGVAKDSGAVLTKTLLSLDILVFPSGQA